LRDRSGILEVDRDRLQEAEASAGLRVFEAVYSLSLQNMCMTLHFACPKPRLSLPVFDILGYTAPT
jgi:hypothetical protein